MNISFSGSSYSGKTYTINRLQKDFKDIITYDEIIRSKSIKSIDEIRKDAQEYLKLQREIVIGKMIQEKNADKNKLNLFDRSLADSLYYGMIYLDSNTLKDEYYSYISNIVSRIKSFRNNIDKVFFFEPLEIPDDLNDDYRPVELKLKQQQECNTIYTLNCLIYGFDNIIRVNSMDYEKIYSIIKLFLEKKYENNKTS